MIDRLEQLLEQVERHEPEEETGLLAVTGGVGTLPPPPAARTGGEELLSPGLSGRRVELPFPFAGRTEAGSDSALPELYRQLAAEAAGQQAGKSPAVAVVHESVPSAAAGLTAGELDRAIRRDSRRYDGGMTIY